MLAAAVTVAPPEPATATSVVSTYCVSCHNQRLKTAGLVLEGLDPAHVETAPEVWEKVVKKLQLRVMPPQGVRRPDEATYRRVVSTLEDDLDRLAAAHPNPGRPLLHRLNRAEYANAIRDLLALEVDTTSLLPPDDAAYGFDNVSDVLGVSPVLLERYLAAAGRISALAIGDPATPPGSETYRNRQDLSQDQQIDGLPLGTVGGLRVRHLFPLDGEYTFALTLFRNNVDAIRGLESPHQIEIAVDGSRVLLQTVGGTATREPANVVEGRLRVRVPVTAGSHDVTATFVRKIGEGTERVQPFLRSSIDTFDATGRPHIETLTIAGPFEGKAPSDLGTASRRKIFVCRPASSSDEQACATRILTRLARLAYRRPVGDGEVKPLLAFFEDGRRKGSFDAGIQMALRRMLASPKFVFRGEREAADTAAGAPYPISDIELASRLSFFLWSSIPDDALLSVAESGTLHQPAVLAREVRRLLADPKADALVVNFGGQWLHLRNLRSLVPNSNTFPDFDDNLRQAFLQETELFFGSIVHEDRSALDLLTADYTFVNERLARHYGIPNVYGEHFRRMVLQDDARRGLLGKGAILMVTSHADRTSPVVRGKWILENLVGAPPPPPPPNVPPLKDPDGSAPQTMRQQMEQHRASPVCATCHKVMDPLGFALENFDAVGAWRSDDAGAPIDASGQLADGTRINGVVKLREALAGRPEVFVGTLVEKLLIYGLGRGLSYSDMPAVRAIVRRAAADDYRVSSIVEGIVDSQPFRYRMMATAGEQARVARAGARP
jgi:hypothetical protein